METAARTNLRMGLLLVDQRNAAFHVRFTPP